MKANATQYAQALYSLTKDKEKQEIDKTVSDFFEALKQKRQVGLVNRIIEKFSLIYNKENNIVEVEITTKNEMDEEQKKFLKEFLKNKYQASEVFLKEKIDKEIGGGLVIRVGDELFDGSVRNRIKNLKSSLLR